MKSYLVAGRMPWNRTVFDEDVANLPGRWDFIASPELLTTERLRALGQRYILFMLW